MNTPARRQETPTPSTIEDVLIRGNLSDLTPQQRVEYVARVCQSLGMNPLTRPFEFLTLNGKLVLYAKRDAADQLRKINGISIEIVGREISDGLLIVHARAKDKTGRDDEDFGVVAFKGGGGEFMANAMMKAVTKAKRRVTLSISGLGFLDETEVGATVPELDEGPSFDEDPEYISKHQLAELHKIAAERKIDLAAFCNHIGVNELASIPAALFDKAKEEMERKRKVDKIESGPQ
jgi:hypothetical protein